MMMVSYEPHLEKTSKSKAQISCVLIAQISRAVNAQLISAFAKSEISKLAIFCGCTAKFVTSWSETSKTGFPTTGLI